MHAMPGWDETEPRNGKGGGTGIKTIRIDLLFIENCVLMIKFSE